MNDLLVSVLRRAAQRGATAADGYLVEESRFGASVRMGEIETLSHSREQRLALRVFAGRASAAASTSDLSRESLERVVDEATALAKITGEDPHAGLPEPSALIERVPDLDLEDGSDDLSPEEKIEIARRAEAAALEADSRITNSEGAEYSDRRAHYAYATSHGFVQGYSTTSFGISVAPIASRNGEMQRDYWYSTARKRARLEDPAAIGRTAAARALRRLGARKMKTVEVPVVFDPDTAASLVRSIAGAASGPSLYRRASFLLDRLGTRIASADVTIVDDPLIPAALGSRPFDGEGLATRRTALVHDGVLESYLLDTYSVYKAFNHPPLPGYLAMLAYDLHRATGIRFQVLFKMVPVASDVLTALLLSRVRLRPGSLRLVVTGYLGVMLGYGAVNLAQDLWHEQVVKRGWTDVDIPSALLPGLRPIWLVIVVLAVVLAVLLLREDNGHVAEPAPT